MCFRDIWIRKFEFEFPQHLWFEFLAALRFLSTFRISSTFYEICYTAFPKAPLYPFSRTM